MENQFLLWHRDKKKLHRDPGDDAGRALGGRQGGGARGERGEGGNVGKRGVWQAR